MICIIPSSIAEYSMRFNLDPQSIQLKQPVIEPNWIPVDSLFTAWENSGPIANCSNWSPTADSMIFDEYFTQTATDCIQNQTRYVQHREQNSVTLEFKNVGEPIIENNSIIVSNTREEMGMKVVGECFYASGDSNTNTFWIARNYSDIVTVTWKGIPLTHSVVAGNTYKIDNDKYTKIDPLKKTTDFGANKYDYYYQICKH